MAPEAIFGPRTANLCFSPGLLLADSLHVWMHGDIGVHQRFQAPGEPRERATHASRSVSLILFQSTPDENVWPPHSNL